MNDLNTTFEQAVAYIKLGTGEGKEPNNQQRLQFYALFKQINDGPCNGPAPSKLKMVERAKYDAWKKLGNMNKEQAQKEYIKLITELSPNWQKPKPKL